MALRNLIGQVALVTGASRGVGRGIALELGRAGATVYMTALEPSKEDSVVQSVASKLPNFEQVVNEINSSGGHAIGIYCDHANPKEVKNVFEQIAHEQNNQLDILVNNAFSAVTLMLSVMHKKFFDLPEDIYDTVNNVGLRGHYMCARLAAKMMVPRRKGLIVTTSSPGGLGYVFNVAYGINKAGCDRLAADMAIELKEFNVASISLWPGAVKSELFMDCNLLGNETVNKYFDHAESLTFSGKCVAALASDPNIMDKTGQILTDMELAKEYNLYEEDGSQPHDEISFKNLGFIKQLNKIRSQIQL